MFECPIETVEGVIVARPVGKITGGEAGTFLASLQDNLPEKDGKLVVDLSKLNYIGSQGISLFIFLTEAHSVRVAAAPAGVLAAFKALMLDKLIPFHTTAAEAIAAFRAK
ncbi:MAG: STAS domain-containing protein [Planctomycetes bacterium]|nr:STAS domain-containing protein [Planctomycetota bacterium]